MSKSEGPSVVLRRVLDRIVRGEALPVSLSYDNPLAGSIGRFWFAFEGEEDLLHLSITSEPPPTVDEAQELLKDIFPGVPVGLIRLKPGQSAIHFYIGQDDLQSHIQLDLQ